MDVVVISSISIETLLCYSLQGVFVANKKALLERKEVLDVVHEMLERFEAHLTAQGQFTVISDTSILNNVTMELPSYVNK